MKGELEEYLTMAEEYYAKGLKLLREEDFPDAAEKVWASVKTITLALTQKYLGRVAPEKGEYWRDFVTKAFLRAGVSEKESADMADYFIKVRDILHGACFYGLSYEEKEHKPLIEAAKNYLNKTRKLLSH